MLAPYSLLDLSKMMGKMGICVENIMFFYNGVGMKKVIKMVLLFVLVLATVLGPVQEARAVSCPPGAIISGVPALGLGIHLWYGLKKYESRCAAIAEKTELKANDYESIHGAHPELAIEDFKLGVEAWGTGLLVMLTFVSLAGY